MSFADASRLAREAAVKHRKAVDWLKALGLKPWEEENFGKKTGVSFRANRKLWKKDRCVEKSPRSAGGDLEVKRLKAEGKEQQDER